MNNVLYLGLLACLVFGLLGCPNNGRPGDSCIVQGDGFTRRDSCHEMCLVMEITCLNDETITPNVCSGPVCGTGGQCEEGLICLQVDSVPENARCIPEALCNGGEMDKAEPVEDIERDSDFEAPRIEPPLPGTE